MRLMIMFAILCCHVGCEPMDDASAPDGAADDASRLDGALPDPDSGPPEPDADDAMPPPADANPEDGGITTPDMAPPLDDAGFAPEDLGVLTDAAPELGPDGGLPADDAGVGPPNEAYAAVVPPVDADGTLLPFHMGSPNEESGRHVDETRRPVYLTRAYWMKITEVTRVEWEAHFEPGLYQPTPELDCPDCPVAGMNFFNALEYANLESAAAGLPPCYQLDRCTDAEPGTPEYLCASVSVTAESGDPYDCLGYRLPMEAEWEYAARAGANGPLPDGAPDADGVDLDALYAEMKIRSCADVGGDALGGPAYAGINDCAVYEAHRAARNCDNEACLVEVAQVGEPNAFGLSDMLGNVSEWVWDGYEIPTDSAQLNPIGSRSVQRVIRGGSYRTPREHIRLAFRSMALPSSTRAPAFHDGIGFRLVRTNHAQVWDPPGDVQAPVAPEVEEPEDAECRQVRRHLKEVFIAGRDYRPLTPQVGSGALEVADLRIDDTDIQASVDDGLSSVEGASSSVAKATAINESFDETGVHAAPGSTLAIGALSPVRAVTLDLDNHLVLNGEIIAGVEVLDGDAAPGPVSEDPVDAARRAHYVPRGASIPQGEDEGLLANDVVINGVPIRVTADEDDAVSPRHSASSAIAKAVAINESTALTGVVAEVLPTVVRGTADIGAVQLDSTNNLFINGEVFCDVSVNNDDAGGPVDDDPVAGARAARLESARPIRVNDREALRLDDVQINRTGVPATRSEDDDLSTIYNAASAIAKASAVNAVSDLTGVEARALPTVVTGPGAVQAMDLDSTNGVVINGAVFCDVSVNDDDAGGPESDRPEDQRRRALMSSSTEIDQGEPERLQNGDVEINGVGIRATVPGDDPNSTQFPESSAIAKAAVINEAFEMTGVEARALPTRLLGVADIAAVLLDDVNQLVINDRTIAGIRVDDGGSQDLVDLINDATAQTGVIATLRDRRLNLEAADGRNITVRIRGNATRLGLAAAAGTVVQGGRLQLESSASFIIGGWAYTKLGDLGYPGKNMACAVRADGADNLRSVINAATQFTGVSAHLNDNQRLVLTAQDGRNIDLMVFGAGVRLGLSGSMGQFVYGGRLWIESPDSIRLSGNNLSRLGDLGGSGTTLACPVRLDGTDNLRSAINARSDLTGVIADLDEDDRLRLTAADGRNIEYSVSGNASRLGLSARFGTTVVGGRIGLTSAETILVSSPNNQLRKIGIERSPLLVPRVRADGSDNLRSLINAVSPRTGVTAALNPDDSLVLTARDGRNIDLLVFGLATRLGFPAGESVFRGPLTLSSEQEFSLEMTPEGAARIGFDDIGKIHRTTHLTSRDYLFCDAGASFVDAQHHCEDSGGHLVGFNSVSESHWITATRGSAEPAWIGHLHQDGGWRRSDGQAYGVLLLDQERRNGCALLDPDEALWQAADCDHIHPFICAL